jgi:hypothetical protein
MYPHSRRALRPSRCKNSSPSKERGRRECRVRAAPAVSCAMCTRSAHTSIQGSGGNPTFPAQWLYGLYRALPGDEFILSPSLTNLWNCETRLGSQHLRRLDTSNGCQDHTVLPYAIASFVCVPSIAHGRPALRSRLRADAAASTASRPNVRDDGQRPSSGRDGNDLPLIWVK